VDALSNYITALGYDPDNETQPALFEKNWPADVHVIGKDILRFHTIYWPIFLMALGIPLPKKVFGHPWFNFGTDKMSKSRGNVVYADDLANRFGVDGVRYYCLSEMPYASDGSVTYENIIKRYNTDLANNLGNLVSRTHAMCTKYFGGIIPESADIRALDAELVNAMQELILAMLSEKIYSAIRPGKMSRDEQNIKYRQLEGYVKEDLAETLTEYVTEIKNSPIHRSELFDGSKGE
jgi:methionyl-tRNA synthetase